MSSPEVDTELTVNIDG